MNAYLQLCRPLNVVMAAAGFIVACFMVAGADIIDSIGALAASTVLVMVFVSGGNALNDSIDAEIDRISHPERPVPTGRVSKEAAGRFGLILLISSFLISFLSMDIRVIAIAGIATVLMVAYEMLLKQRGFVGNLTIALLTGMVFLLGGAVMSRMTESVFPCLMAAMVTVGREVAKDVEDMEGDEGRRTLPMAIGRKAATAVAAAFFIAGPVISIAPMFMGLYGPLYYSVLLADAVFVIASIRVFEDARKGQKTAKAGMILGLLAFILGVFRF